ncbi:hypothetical protein M514_09004 [Trichuris suis]|uniref:Reverse transcriptase domain-containing protein n=1 Tax=Trichuris suis TaxID=68888 RepID=A0A085MZ68_9BILA|nr:hypothetical protein M513_09004 [Trichuris suis]KFD62514.1 hypothetical protein M514_09004 [Trichuris suis]
MDGPFSPILAEIFMEHLEEKAFSTPHVSDTPVFFKRDIDDRYLCPRYNRKARNFPGTSK